MADQFVLEAQKYLNNRYGGYKGVWVPLAENGQTGTLMIEGLIRAFQIENGVPNVTGYLGPYTVGVMKSLQEISIMDPNDEPNPNVALIQCALFCKGYHAGGITGIYYTNGVNAVKEMQSDASIGVTGTINWKVWMGLFSMYWFKLVSGGNTTIRTIQKQLNSDWSDVLGVQACDGVMSRNTALSLVGALQAAEGLTTWIDDLSLVNFGDATTANCPTLRQGVNGNNIKFNKIAQYGLYFNGINQRKFDGVFDSDMSYNVSQFQDKYGLTGMINDDAGVIGVSTMKSLLTSKGDTGRLALACDCSTVLNAKQASDLYNSGYRYIGRYLTGTVGVGAEERSKALTISEIKAIQNAGLSIFPIYQDGGYYSEYFGKTLQGSYDAVTAIQRAKRLGFTNGTTIYFAVDFDCLEYETDGLIIPYFRQINTVFNQSVINGKHYKVGIYAPRYVCTKVYEAGLAEYSFVADMSTGFSGNLGYAIPENWAFDQFFEFTFSSSPSFDLDKVGFSGRDSGCRLCENQPDFSDDELLQEAREKYVKNIAKATGYLDKILGTELSFDNAEYNLGTIAGSGISMSTKLKLSTSLNQHPNSPYSINISWEGDDLSPTCKSQIEAVSAMYESDAELSSLITTTLEEMAIGAKVGTISFFATPISSTMLRINIICETDNLMDFAGVVGNVSCEFESIITIYPSDPSIDFEFNGEALVIGVTVAVVACLVLISSSGTGVLGLSVLIESLGKAFAVA